MIYLPPVFELTLVGVMDANVPNQERIIIRPTERVNLGHFGIFLARLDPSQGGHRPLADRFFWFGDVEVEPPAWVIVYTGHGKHQRTKIRGRDEQALVYHWGRDFTVFANENVKPVLFRIGAIAIGQQLAQEGVKHLSTGNP